MKNKWYKAEAGEGEGVVKVVINGDIGDHWWDGGDVTSDRFMNTINAFGDVSEIYIDINSPGGSVSGGLTIANFLHNHPAKVVANVLGQASSIASVIASACDEVHMGLGAFMFLHRASTYLYGNAMQMQATVNDLETIDKGIMDVYARRCGDANREKLEALIAGPDGNGTLVSAEMAVELGLADSMLETQAAASISDTVQSFVRAQREADALAVKGGDEALTAVDILAQAFEIESSEVEGQAEDLIARIVEMRAKDEETSPLDALDTAVEWMAENHPEVTEKIKATVDVAKSVREAVANERERVGAIVKACATTSNYKPLQKMLDESWEASKATDYILATADVDGIDGNHSPEGGQSVGIDTTKIYDRRNRRNGK